MSRAWFALAVAGVLGLFYVGHGLHGGAPPSFTSVASAQEAAKPRRISWQHTGTLPDTTRNFFRSKITGGWLLVVESGRSDGWGPSLTFVPDADHKWDGNSLP